MSDRPWSEREHCESCGVHESEEALRAIQIIDSDDRELLCESCFTDALQDNRISPRDERLQ